MISHAVSDLLNYPDPDGNILRVSSNDIYIETRRLPSNNSVFLSGLPLGPFPSAHFSPRALPPTMPSAIANSQPLQNNFTTDTNSLSRFDAPNSRLSYYVALGLVLLCIWLFQPAKSKCCVSAPFYKASRLKWMFGADTLIKDSYNKFRDCVYQVKSTEGIRTIIPANLIGELKGLPEETLSAQIAVSEAMLSEYTQLSAGAHSETLTLLLKTKTTQNLARMGPKLREELEYILATEFPACDDWTPFKIQPFMIRVVSRLSGRAFVGPQLNRSEEWMDVSINFAITAFIAVIKLQFFPPWMRPAAQHLVSELRTIRRDLGRAQAMVAPLIRERLSRRDAADPDASDADADADAADKPDDFVQWLLDALPAEQRGDCFIQAKIQLLLAASSIHTTSNLTTDCIYDLAVHQDMQEILRQEVLEVLGGEGEAGLDRRDNMARLKKMDSFIKESQRLSGNITSFIRKVMKPIDLSDGTHLPAGTDLLTPLAGVAVDERFYPDPETFDGLRFWKLRQHQEAAEEAAATATAAVSGGNGHGNGHGSVSVNNGSRWQFTSIGDTSANFGLGKHACPGRFLASHEIKLVLAHLLLHYECRLRDGEARPQPTTFMMTRGPSQTAEVLFRRR
ncbi:ent-kaurene oxidase [Xylariaceae sp. FL0804]|nr:ent-kaurene oxidase [Xylariaceae sp. FL0804]